MGMYSDVDLGVDCSKDKILTKQSFKDEVDINKIVSRFEKTGMLENINGKEPFYGDVSDLVSYKDAINVVENARELFMEMSPEIRERFKNDPMEMIDFLADDKNKAEAIKLGMILEKPVIKPVEVTPVVTDVPK